MKPILILILYQLVQIYPAEGQTFDYSEAQVLNSREYLIHKTSNTLRIDGNLNEPGWKEVQWTSSFLDIEGDKRAEPHYQTKAKMLWDDNYFYYAAEMEDPHVWGTITVRDAVIFMDNNLEIFIDPDGDTHNYYELEINALGTYWDLLLTKPYINGGRAINAWDIKGLKIGISVNGTLNDPSDTDKGWTVEVAIPWNVLMETVPGTLPTGGDQWKLNFSRVQWHTDIIDGKYVKQTDPETGEQLPEENWSWSPQGLINMHYPEMWGTIQFSDQPPGSAAAFNRNPVNDYKWLMRVLFYRQIEYRNQNGHYADQPGKLGFQDLFKDLFDDEASLPILTISVMDRHYIMKLETTEIEQIIYIQSNSRVWTENR